MRLRLAWLVSAILGLVLFSGCSNGAEPTAGTLKLSFTSPHDDDGAVLLSISGGPIDSVESSGLQLYSERPDAGTVRLILTGNLSSGAIARVYVPDTRQASRYTVSITQVAARASYAQRDPAAYSISLEP